MSEQASEITSASGGSHTSSRRIADNPLFSPFGPRFYADPYPHYEQLRREGPVYLSALRAWFFGHYTDIRAVLKDPRFRALDIHAFLRRKSNVLLSTSSADSEASTLEHLLANAKHWLAFIEGPEHARLRGQLTRPLARGTVESLRPFIRESACSLLHEQLARGEMDIMGDFARALPFYVLAKMFGLPGDMLANVQAWTGRLTRAIDSLNSISDLVSLEKASIEFMEYLRGTLSKPRRDRDGGCLSFLCSVQNDGDSLSEDEAISLGIFLFMAGLETTTYFLGNAALALIKRPNEYRSLSNNLDILPSAVDELLRFDSPLQMITRTAMEDVELGGKTIRAGEQVYLVLGSANRDPGRFCDPDNLLLERQQNHHLAFGDGRHMCVGAQLVRIEGQEALRALLEVIPDMQANTNCLEWRPHLLSRGLATLPVRFST